MKFVDNPYQVKRPAASAAAFVGRAALLDSIREQLVGSRARTIALRGPRQIGKTSLLHRLRAVLPEWGSYRPVLVDLRSKSTTPTALGQMLQALVRAVARGLKISATELMGPPDMAFRDAWLPDIIAGLKGAKLVLMLDSFNRVVDDAFVELLAAFYRYLIKVADGNPDFVVIAALGPESFPDVFSGRPLFEVGALDQDEVSELVLRSEKQGTLRWSAKARATIWALSRGHPAFVQLLASEVWEDLNYYDPSGALEVTEAEVQSSAERAAEAASHIIVRIWDSLPPEARLVAAALAERPEPVTSLDALSSLLDQRGVHDAARIFARAPALLAASAVIDRPSGDDGFQPDSALSIGVPMLRRAIRAHCPLRRVQVELDRIAPEADRCYRAALGLVQAEMPNGPDEVVARLRAALELNPNHARATALLADILLKTRQQEEAFSLLERLYEVQPDAARPQLIEALLMEAQRSVEDDRRLELHERILQYAPGNREARGFVRNAYGARAEEALARGERAAAYEAYKKAGMEEEARSLEADLRKEAITTGLAELARLREEEDFADAVTCARSLAEKYPEAHEDWDGLFEQLDGDVEMVKQYEDGLAALEEGERKKAQHLLSTVASRDPSFRDVARYLYKSVHGEDPQESMSRSVIAELASSAAASRSLRAEHVAPDAVEAQPVAPESAGSRAPWGLYLVLGGVVVVLVWVLMNQKGNQQPQAQPQQTVSAPAAPAAPVDAAKDDRRPDEPSAPVTPAAQDVEDAAAPGVPAAAPTPAGDDVDIGPALERAEAALASLEPTALDRVEVELMEIIHDRKSGTPDVAALASARALRAEVLLMRALSVAIVQTIEPKMIEKPDSLRAVEDITRAQAELNALTLPPDSDAVLLARYGRARALQDLVEGKPIEGALDKIPATNADGVRALVHAADLWRSPTSVEQVALGRLIERFAAGADADHVTGLMHGLALYRMYELSGKARDKKSARVVVLPMRGDESREPIAWALHRALTRPPAASSVYDVFKIVKSAVRKRCKKPVFYDVIAKVRIEPRRGRVTLLSITPKDQNRVDFDECVRARVKRVRFESFSMDPIEEAELVF